MAIPQSPAQASAFDRLFAQGGRLTRSGKYTQGRLLGLTHDQVMEKAKTLWANSPDGLREKYAKRAQGNLAPSEAAAYASEAGDPTGTRFMDARPGETTAQRYARQQAALAGVGTPTAPVSTFPSLTAPSPVPAGRAQPVGRNADLPTDERMHAEGKTNGGLTPVVKAPPSPTTPSNVATPFPVADPVMLTKSSSDNDYATIADQRAATGYPAATRAVPFTNTDVIKAKDAGFGPTPTPTGSGGKSRINPLTKLPFGYVPGDAVAPAQAADAAASVQRQAEAASAYKGPDVAPPKATLAPAPVRYADQQSQYQANGLDPKFQSAAEKIYKGANSIDQARITANSLKRAASIR